MKVVVNIVIALVVLLAAAIGGSLLFLPAKVTQASTVTIERPASTVFALLASMPATHPSGEGVTQRVTGEIKGIAEGLTTELSGADGRKFVGVWTIAPQGPVTSVKLEVTEELGMNPISRFQGQSGAQLQPVLKGALDAIAAEATAVPNFDFAALNYQALDVASRRFIYVEAQTQQDADRIKDAINQAVRIVQASLSANNLVASGFPIAVETAWEDGKYSFWAGLPYEGAQPLNLIGTKEGPTPSGPAIKVVYEGPEAAIIPVYDQMEALMKATRMEKGQSMEVYLDDPTQAGGSQKREIYYFIRSGDVANITRFAPPGTGAPALPSAVPAQLPPPAATPAPTPAPAAMPAPAATAPAATPAPAPAPAPAEPAKK